VGKLELYKEKLDIELEVRHECALEMEAAHEALKDAFQQRVLPLSLSLPCLVSSDLFLSLSLPWPFSLSFLFFFFVHCSFK
jgi:hypothetical protein